MTYILLLIIIVIVGYLIYTQRGDRKRPLAEAFTRAVTEDDVKQALQAFYKKKCLEKRHSWTQSPDGQQWDCHYSQETCKENSSWPEVSSDDAADGIARLYQYWNADDGKCYLGYGA